MDWRLFARQRESLFAKFYNNLYILNDIQYKLVVKSFRLRIGTVPRKYLSNEK